MHHSAGSQMNWDPDQYSRFSDHRLRPALDLIARVPEVNPSEVWDLGCGTGAITEELSRRWPAASVHGIDASPEMLGLAAERSGIDWVLGDIASWDPQARVDVVFSNAALHWLDHHDSLLPRLASSLSPGGVMAIQMPRNHSAASHQVLYELARSSRWQAEVGHLVVESPVDTPEHYHALLSPMASRLDVWETTYHQALRGPDPVAQWTRGTALRPYLKTLGDDGDDFFGQYAAALRPHYPMRGDGITIFPFRRVFIVAML